jgi:hypothetical protein
MPGTPLNRYRGRKVLGLLVGQPLHRTYPAVFIETPGEQWHGRGLCEDLQARSRIPLALGAGHEFGHFAIIRSLFASNFVLYLTFRWMILHIASARRIRLPRRKNRRQRDHSPRYRSVSPSTIRRPCDYAMSESLRGRNPQAAGGRSAVYRDLIGSGVSEGWAGRRRSGVDSRPSSRIGRRRCTRRCN